MSAELPLVLNIRTRGTDSGAVDTEVYCVNATPDAFRVAASSRTFSTIDDEGTVMEHGAPPVELELQPGDAGRISDVVAWEWDGAVGLLVVFTNLTSGLAFRAVYSLAQGIGHRRRRAPADREKSGYISPPTLVLQDEGHSGQRTSSAS